MRRRKPDPLVRLPASILQAPENPSLTPHARPPPAARMPQRIRAGAAPCGARRVLICSVSPLCLGAAAMENKGLNVFNTSCVLAKPETGTRTAASRAPTVRARVGALRGRPQPPAAGDKGGLLEERAVWLILTAFDRQVLSLTPLLLRCPQNRGPRVVWTGSRL